MDDIGFRMMRLAAQGYCCSQILILLDIENRDQSNPDLVRAMAGLCLGGAESGGVCGVFTGAACLLALYAAKGAEGETADDKLSLMYAELSEWFARAAGEPYGGIFCTDIIGGETRRPNPDRCGCLLAEAYQQVTAILVQNGFDLTGPHSHEY